MKVSKGTGQTRSVCESVPKELEVLEHHVSVKRRRDEVLFRVDDRAHSCLCLVEGKVEVFIPKEHQEENIATITAGQSVGHLADRPKTTKRHGPCNPKKRPFWSYLMRPSTIVQCAIAAGF